MSLRIFHIIFIVVTVALSLFVALWGFREFAAGQKTIPLVLALVFLANAAALIVYGKRVFGKLRDLP